MPVLFPADGLARPVAVLRPLRAPLTPFAFVAHGRRLLVDVRCILGGGGHDDADTGRCQNVAATQPVGLFVCTLVRISPPPIKNGHACYRSMPTACVRQGCYR